MRGTVSISSTTVTNNKGTGIIAGTGTLTVDSSTITGNRGRLAGGLSFWFGNVTVRNSTISSNSCANNGDAGGIGQFLFSGGSLDLFNSTVHGNMHDNAAAAGQLRVKSDSTVRVRNTILSGDGSNPNIVGTLTSLGHNLSSDASGNLNGPGDLTNANPLLGPLQNNGGPTLTHALLPGSPAIDAGDNADAPEFDQRGPGFPRIVNGTIDIGAFEVQATGAPSTNLAVLLTADFSRLSFRTRDLD